MQTRSIDDLSLDELWQFVKQGQMPEERYREIERERETGRRDEEVEITEGMIRAGVNALYTRDFGEEPGEWTVKRVYQAMEAARAGRPLDKTLWPGGDTSD